LTITLRDTTLREGIQMPGSRVTPDQKREFIGLLARAGVPEIEIGLPDGVSACLETADLIREMELAIRCTALIPFYTTRWKQQIDQAVAHGIHRLDVLGPTSDYLLNNSKLYGMTADEVLDRIRPPLEYAASQPVEISLGLIDATRAPWERLEKILAQAKAWGASRIVFYDSVGIMTPVAMKTLVAKVCAAAGIPVLVHCHNDYGMATANSLAAVEGGATALDVAVNGVGGRAGNAALEETALALKNLYGMETGIDLRMLTELSAMTEIITGARISPTKPVVGSYCFAHLPVMHIRCIAGGNPEAFEPYPPEQIGASRRYSFSLPVDYSAALEPFLARSGLALTSAQVREVLDALREREGVSESEIQDVIRSKAQGLEPAGGIR
jgi:isopropylmalate/homocitrate/citramalate synthase